MTDAIWVGQMAYVSCGRPLRLHSGQPRAAVPTCAFSLSSCHFFLPDPL